MEFKLLDYVYLLCSYFKFYLCLKYVGGQLKENNNKRNKIFFLISTSLFIPIHIQFI